MDAQQILIDENDPSLLNKNYELLRKRKLLQVELQNSFLQKDFSKCLSSFYWALIRSENKIIDTGKWGSGKTTFFYFLFATLFKFYFHFFF